VYGQYTDDDDGDCGSGDGDGDAADDNSDNES